ncbi:MAG: hypothetical protein K6U88_03510 [Dehalococcoidia bacterium]|nr:hypothetical protein [Dehalococcoidia bacterium]
MRIPPIPANKSIKVNVKCSGGKGGRFSISGLGNCVSFFQIAPNEAGETGSHQRGEIYVAASQLSGLLPDLSGRGAQTTDHVIPLFNAQLGEWGTVTVTRFGGRYTPEVRLRRLPAHWIQQLVSGDLIVIVEADGFGIFYSGSSVQQFPPGLQTALARALSSGRTKGVAHIPGPKVDKN